MLTSSGDLPAQLGDGVGALQRAQALDRRPGHVDGVRRAERLGEHVVDPGRLEDGAGGATGDDTGAGRGRLEQHAAASCSPRITWVMVEPARGTLKRFFLASSMPFWIAAGTSFALPYPRPTLPFSVADDDERGEREPPAALHDLGDPVDRDHPLFVLAFGHDRPASDTGHLIGVRRLSDCDVRR